MKKNLFKSLIAGVLALTLIFGAMAVAENTADAAASSQTETGAADAAASSQAETGAADAAAAQAEQEAFSEAVNALRNARQKAAKQELETEIKGYVAAGEMTQEQADLLLRRIEERQAQRSARQSGRKNAPGMGRNNGGQAGCPSMNGNGGQPGGHGMGRNNGGQKGGRGMGRNNGFGRPTGGSDANRF